jgi:hypothetical protein
LGGDQWSGGGPFSQADKAFCIAATVALDHSHSRLSMLRFATEGACASELAAGFPQWERTTEAGISLAGGCAKSLRTGLGMSSPKARMELGAVRSLMILVYLAALSDAVLSNAAMGQGAATGGTKDTGSPTMVFPIRPRDEPPSSTAVPNVPRSQPSVVRLRRHYYYRHRSRGY